MPMGSFLPNPSLDHSPHLPAASPLQNAVENANGASQSGIASNLGCTRAQLL